MSLSPNIGLTLTPLSETTKTFQEWRRQLSGDGDGSNMMIIDREIGEIKQKFPEMVLWTQTQPAGQSNGGIWNEILV